MTANGPRPFGVTLVGFIIFVVGALGVIVGILALLNRDPALDTLGMSAIVVTLVVGLIYLLVGKGIFNGNRGSRFLVGLLTVLNLIAGVIAALSPDRRLSGLVQVVVSVIILGLLYNGSARRYFG